MRFVSSPWRWIRAENARVVLFGALLGAVIGALLTSELAGETHIVASLFGPATPYNKITDIRDRSLWVSPPTMYPQAVRALNRPAALIEDLEPNRPVRTSQELVNDASALAGQVVVVVGKIAVVEHRQSPFPPLRTEISLSGDEGRLPIVHVVGFSLKQLPPLTPKTPGRLVPLPGSLQRFNPEFRYAVFVGMIGAIGTSLSPGGGPIRTVYFFAVDGMASTRARAIARRSGIAVREAFRDLMQPSPSALR